jgi:hypothetical protein
VVVLLGNVDSSSFFLYKKKGVSRRSLSWVKGSGSIVVGYAISFYAMGGFGFLLLSKFTIVTGAFVLGILLCIGYTCYYWAYTRGALFSVDSFWGALGEFLAVWSRFFLAYWAFVCGEFVFFLFYYWVQYLGR